MRDNVFLRHLATVTERIFWRFVLPCEVNQLCLRWRVCRFFVACAVHCASKSCRPILRVIVGFTHGLDQHFKKHGGHDEHSVDGQNSDELKHTVNGGHVDATAKRNEVVEGAVV